MGTKVVSTDFFPALVTVPFSETLNTNRVFFCADRPFKKEIVMDLWIERLLLQAPTILLLLVVAVTLYTLAKGADILVDEAVSLSIRLGIPKMVIGATIVSLGTTLPEATVSVLAAVKGNPDLALGNAIGSIIVDTGLIIGIAALLGTLPVDPMIVKRQGRIQFLAGVSLAVICLPFFGIGGNGIIHQWMGFVFLGLLALYLYVSMKWAKNSKDHDEEALTEEKSPVFFQMLKLFLGIAIVILSSKVLIPAVGLTAGRIGIPQSVIAATLVAFGTSLPELITAITAVKKGHGELAVGNVVGADILNVLFVIGGAAAFTPSGLMVPNHFYRLQIPAMLIILTAFRLFSISKEGRITRKEGLFLSFIYVIYLILNYVL